jgi:hypothetical protein
VVLYFLSNARTWKGEVAKRVKAELKKMATWRNTNEEKMKGNIFLGT